MVKMKIGTPLLELRNRLTEELARRESKESLVPIDRDPCRQSTPSVFGDTTRNSAGAADVPARRVERAENCFS
jgi:hypothetical protein